MKLAFLYAGQGSQHAGMGRDLYEDFHAFRAVLEQAAAAVDFDIKEVMFTDAVDILNETQYTQPCMTAFACGVTAVLRQAGIVPDYAAGLSLGEYPALACAGVFDAQTAVSLTAFRGKAMAAAVQICNYNCPGQLVIGGDKAAVDKAADAALTAGAKRCLPLKVSGAFHTALMHPAGDALREKFKSVAFSQMQMPVLFNCLGHEKNENDSIPALLEKQVQTGVQWESTLRRLAELGVDTAIEIGPGKVLTGFVKKTVGSAISCYPVETSAQLQQLLRTRKGA